MLTISGLKNFYYIPGVTDMRCGYNRLLQIVKQMTHHDPFNGDVFVFMSKDRRKVKMVHFENHAYYIHEKVFTNGYRFMLLEYRDEKGVLSYFNYFSYLCKEIRRYGIGRNISQEAAFAAPGISGIIA